MTNKPTDYFSYITQEDEKRQRSNPEDLARHVIRDSKPGYSPRRQAIKNSTYLSFLDDLIDVWNQIAENDRAEGDPLRDVKIARRYSTDEDKEVNAIIYRLIERKPSEAHKDVDYRYRGDIPHPHRPDEFVKVYSQKFEVVVEFRVLSMKSDDADKIVREFSSFIRRYRPFLTIRGVDQFRFIKQGSDEKDMTHRGENHIRPLYYKFYIEEFDYDTEKTLKQVKILTKSLSET